jgi:hypothetical protein
LDRFLWGSSTDVEQLIDTGNWYRKSSYLIIVWKLWMRLVASSAVSETISPCKLNTLMSFVAISIQKIAQGPEMVKRVK